MVYTRFFHPKLTSSEAAALLREKGTPGSFLIRKSGSDRKNYVLCCLTEDGIIHFTIKNTDDGLQIADYFYSFSSLNQMVKHFEKGYGAPSVNNVEIKLKQPIPYSEPTNERWFHGFLNRREADEMLLQDESGRDNVFLVRRSKSNDTDYVLCVGTEGVLEHIPIYCRNSSYFINEDKRFGCLTDLINSYLGKKLVLADGRHIQFENPVNTTQLEAANITARIERLQKTGHDAENGFIEEYEDVGAHDFSFSSKMAKKQCNVHKNRYKNIIPYDYTRVVLDTKGTSNGADYINASYIQIEDQTWIATQGCIQGTEADFWEMVWQHNSAIVVMMTRLFEAGRAKCEKYWSGERTYFGNFIVETINKTKYPDYKIRHLRIEKERERRDVYQFHFMNWPDFGVPENPVTTLNFVLDVNSKFRNCASNTGPIVVHCSAGIGRSGTFIGIHSLISKISEKGVGCSIDVQKTVLDMRKGRSGMVQTEEQYAHIYNAVAVFVNHEKNRIKRQIQTSKHHRNSYQGKLDPPRTPDATRPRSAALPNIDDIHCSRSKNTNEISNIPLNFKSTNLCSLLNVEQTFQSHSRTRQHENRSNARKPGQKPPVSPTIPRTKLVEEVKTKGKPMAPGALVLMQPPARHHSGRRQIQEEPQRASERSQHDGRMIPEVRDSTPLPVASRPESRSSSTRGGPPVPPRRGS